MSKLLHQPDNIFRAAIVVTPKKPFIDWINSIEPLGEPDAELKEGEVHLIPDLETKEEIMRWLKKHFDLCFTEMLHSWYIDESLWPQKRTFKMFVEWFKNSHPWCRIGWPARWRKCKQRDRNPVRPFCPKTF